MFEYVEKELSHCRAEVKTITKELKSLPDGYLVRRSGYYYHCVNRETRGITKNQPLILGLARKAYLQKRLKCLEGVLASGEAFAADCRRLVPDEIIKSLSEAYRQLPCGHFFGPPDDDWQHEAYETNPFHPEQRSILTNSGIAVRSKSELIIANALEMFYVPYRYEAALVLGGRIRYPDFTIKRPSDGMLIYWEHFGLADQPDYAKNMAAKLYLYTENHIKPWRNLICTDEEDIKDSKRIHQLIEWHILQN